MSEPSSFLDRLTAYLALERDEPLDSPGCRPESLAALKALGTPAPAPQPKRTAAPRPSGSAAQPVSPPSARPAAPAVPEYATLAELHTAIAQCNRCALADTRMLTLPGAGCTQSPDLFFIGEGPGREEEQQQKPFAGESGALLEKMIRAMGYRMEEVFITNVVKCRSFHKKTKRDGAPEPEEAAACLPWLQQQIRLIRPKIIITLGKTAFETLFNQQTAINAVRGKWHDHEGLPVMPIFHPNYLLHAESHKREAWADLKAVLVKLGRTPPAAGKK